jgi:predicted DNA-binding antitoxin AbrB/MazE fold protein
MGKTIRAKVSKGIIRPLEDLGIDDDKEVIITIVEIPDRLEKGDILDKTAGGWIGLVDAEELKKNIYSDRLVSTRPVPNP